jgi:hypothetical protein
LVVGLRLVPNERPETARERPPLVLRWVWIFGPLLVAAAMTGMIFAARSAGRLHTRAVATSGLEVYAEKSGHTYRVTAGSRLHHGQRVQIILVPAGARYATITRDGGVLAQLGPLADTDLRVSVAEGLDLGAPGPLHLEAFLSARPLAPASVQIALTRRAATDDLPAVRVSFDAEVE